MTSKPARAAKPMPASSAIKTVSGMPTNGAIPRMRLNIPVPSSTKHARKLLVRIETIGVGKTDG